MSVFAGIDKSLLIISSGARFCAFMVGAMLESSNSLRIKAAFWAIEVRYVRGLPKRGLSAFLVGILPRMRLAYLILYLWCKFFLTRRASDCDVMNE